MSLRRARVGDAAVAYRRAGAGPPLMLLHGGWSDSRTWTPQLRSLADAFDVVAWDAPGCGGSDDPPAGADLGFYADAVAGLAEALGLARPHIAGLSFGGGLALAVAARHPGLPRALVLTGACAGWAGSLPAQEVAARLARVDAELGRPPAEWAEGYLGGFFAGPVPASARRDVLDMMGDVRAGGQSTMLRAFAAADLRGDLPGIRAPVLILHGAEDARSPRAVAEDLHARIPGSRLTLLDGVGHVANLEAQDRWEAAVRAFLAGVP